MILKFNDVLTDRNETQWFAENRWNALFRKKKSCEVEYVGEFPEEETVMTDGFRNMILCNEYVVFTPFNACNIHLINIETMDRHCVKVANENVKRFKQACLYGSFTYENRVYFLQACDTQIISLEPNTGKVAQLDIIERVKSVDYTRFWGHRVVQRDYIVFLYSEVDARVIEYDILNDTYKEHNYFDYMEQISDFIIDDGRIIIADKQGNVYLDDGMEVILLCRVDCSDVVLIKRENAIFLFSMSKKRIIYDISDESRAMIEDIHGCLENTANCLIEGNYLFAQNDNGVYYKNLSKFCSYEIGIEKIPRRRCEGIIHEDEKMNLRFFINDGVDLFE